MEVMEVSPLTEILVVTKASQPWQWFDKTILRQRSGSSFATLRHDRHIDPDGSKRLHQLDLQKNHNQHISLKLPPSCSRKGESPPSSPFIGCSR
jgi:hypothetical protein